MLPMDDLSFMIASGAGYSVVAFLAAWLFGDVIGAFFDWVATRDWSEKK